MAEPKITPQLVADHGLLPDEYKIKQILGREPSFTELGIFSVMLFLEHCSYKNSIALAIRN